MGGAGIQTEIDLGRSTVNHRLGELTFDDVQKINAYIGSAAGIVVASTGKDAFGELAGIYKKGNKVYLVVDDQVFDRADIRKFEFDETGKFQPEGNYDRSKILLEANPEQGGFKERLQAILAERFQLEKISYGDFYQKNIDVDLASSLFTMAIGKEDVFKELEAFYAKHVVGKGEIMILSGGGKEVETTKVEFNPAQGTILAYPTNGSDPVSMTIDKWTDFVTKA